MARIPADLPGRRAGGLGSRGRITLVVLAVALFLLLTSLRGIAGFYTDYLWFDSLGYKGVFTGVLGAKISLAALFTAVFFVVLWLNLFVADRLAPRFRPAGPEEEVIERYHELIGGRTGLVRTAVALLFALIAGLGVSGQWNSWILFRNATDFGVNDAEFGMDVSFYVFRLPFLTFVVDWAFASIVIVLIVTAVAHYLNGGIRVQGPAQRVTPQVKAHLSLLLGALALLKAAGYWLGRFELTLSTRGAVDGATYTDVKAQLPALNLLVLISLVAFLLLIVNIWRRGWILPVLAVGTWAVIAFLVGTVVPAFIQRFTVEPSESSRERPYIERNIEATRVALGLDQVSTRPFAATDNLTGRDLQDNAETVRNIRLWDPAQLQRVFQRLQEFRPYYRVTDVDVDRYVVDGEIRQTLLSTRELDTADVPQRSWEARHLAYTHGYGTMMAAANSKTPSGGPQLLQRDIPVVAPDELAVEQPGLYIGEGLSGYVVTDTDRQEIDFQDEDGTEFTQYQGADGIGIGGLVRRTAFSLRFWDFNVLISGNIRSDSRILIMRDVRERVEALAPFLHFDGDPYATVVGGRVRWIVDGYTTTNRFPYAQRAELGQLPPGSGLDHGFNYVRNSVKAVVDAYDGTVTYYVVDDSDPIAAAYRKAFPELFSDGDDVPDELRAHFRYPEDLFRVQTNMWGRYHLEDPDDFYNQNDAWNVAQDPEAVENGLTGAQPLDAQGRPIARPREARIDPYYLLMRLPDEEQTEFLILRPFVPVSSDDSRKEMTAFMVAKSDPDSYGEIVTYVMPRNNLPDGPGLAAASIAADEEVATTQTLLGREGSNVRFGNLIVVPIEESLLYVQPFYVEATSTRVPELRKVIVYYGDTVVIENTLQEALEALFGEAPETDEAAGPDDDEGDEGTTGDPGDDIADLLDRAAIAFEEADAALAEGDLGRYQQRIQQGRRFLDEARRRSGAESGTTTTTTTTEPAQA